MASHMKTTIQIAEPLLAEAKCLASREKTTVRALVEEGLRRVLEDRQGRKPFKLRDKSVKGKGLSREFADGSWAKIRDAIYEGRGS